MFFAAFFANAMRDGAVASAPDVIACPYRLFFGQSAFRANIGWETYRTAE